MQIRVVYYVTDAELAGDFRKALHDQDIERLGEIVDALPVTADSVLTVDEVTK